jgi:sulfur carrier protein
MMVFVNDKPRELSAPAPLAQLLEELGLRAPAGIAVAINDTVVPRSEWSHRALADGDRLLIIQAAQGG